MENKKGKFCSWLYCYPPAVELELLYRIIREREIRNVAPLRGRQLLRAVQVVQPKEKPQGQRMCQALLEDPLQRSLLCSKH